MISLVIPIFNEALSLKQLIAEINKVLLPMKIDFEIIFVNDGSTDNSEAIIDRLKQKSPQHIKSIRLRRNFGKATALSAGFNMAKGKVIITMDGDLQDDPKEIPHFIKKIESGFDLVSGWKQHRRDSLIKNTSSKLFNLVTRKATGINLHDFNCGFKAYRAETVHRLALYGELHRYIPALIAAQGYQVGEILVNHRKRRYGKSKYGALRFIYGFFDLLTVIFITKYRLRPLHMIGPIGLIFFLSGLAGATYLTYEKLILNQTIGNRPLLLLSVMSMIMGVQIGITGLVGEQITASIESLKKHDHQQPTQTH